MKQVIQTIATAAACVIIFTAGFYMGKTTADQPLQHMRLTLQGPYGKAIDVSQMHSGYVNLVVPNERVDCIKWVDANFKDAKSGLMAMLCAGVP